jgi:hypothetical protein
VPCSFKAYGVSPPWVAYSERCGKWMGGDDDVLERGTR